VIRLIQSKQDVITLQTTLQFMHDDLEDFDEQEYNDNINQYWENLRHIAMLEHLKTLPLNVLSTLESGLPLNALEARGYETIYDIHHLSSFQLMSIDGVGKISARSIILAIMKIKRSVLEDVTPKIDSDNLSADSFKLLEEIYHKQHTLVEYK